MPNLEKAPCWILTIPKMNLECEYCTMSLSLPYWRLVALTRLMDLWVAKNFTQVTPLGPVGILVNKLLVVHKFLKRIALNAMAQMLKEGMPTGSRSYRMVRFHLHLWMVVPMPGIILDQFS